MSKKKTLLGRKKGLYLRDTGVSGRGVFCAEDIRKGEILEVTPALLLNEGETKLIDKTMLFNYTFVAGALSKRVRERAHIKNSKNCSCVIMGIISFCNHSDKPNAEVLWEEEDGTLYHSIRATRPIPKNTEICTSYGAGWFDDRKFSKVS